MWSNRLLNPAAMCCGKSFVPQIARIHRSAVRRLALFPRSTKDDEKSPGVKVKDVVRVKKFFDEQLDRDSSKSFIDTIENFENIRKMRRFGYAEFIGAALPAMKEFGVHKDLESYKALMRIFPAGAFLPTSRITAGFYPHYVQQRAAVELLAQMEENRVMPDKELEGHIIAAFSKTSNVWEKCARMIYWMTKFKNANPYPFPETLPNDPLELAIIALKRMSVDPQTDVSIYSTTQTNEENEDTWICCAQSESQCGLIAELDPEKYRVSLDGPFQVWVEQFAVQYFVLFARDMTPKANSVDRVEEYLVSEHEKNNVSNIPLSNFGYMKKIDAIDPMRELHTQEDGTILAVVATGTSSQQSLISWVRILERENPRLRSIPIIISNSNSANTQKATSDQSAQQSSSSSASASSQP